MFFALALFGWTSVSVVDGLVLERELVEREVRGGGSFLKRPFGGFSSGTFSKTHALGGQRESFEGGGSS
jgi:hypothetical protein